MARAASLVCCGILVGAGCTAKVRPATGTVDCSQGDAYEFRPIADFTVPPEWFFYADATPGGIPDPSLTTEDNVGVVPLEAPGRCGDTSVGELKASGHNFYGTGFGDYGHNDKGSRANGTGYEGISFWARSPGSTDKTFRLDVDDGRTIVLTPPAADGGGLPTPRAGTDDQDLDGDGFVGPGDIADGTSCRLPPPSTLSRIACYGGGAQPPSTAMRVPEPDECGNQFHTNVTTTEDWQLFLLPWSELVQWPCPNRLAGGIDPSDIAKFEIKFIQGSTYDLWLDNIAFYRRRPDAGSGG